MNVVMGTWYSYCVWEDAKQLIINGKSVSLESAQTIKKMALSLIKAIASASWGVVFAGQIALIAYYPKIKCISLVAFHLFYGEMFCQWWEAEGARTGSRDMPARVEMKTPFMSIPINTLEHSTRVFSARLYFSSVKSLLFSKIQAVFMHVFPAVSKGSYVKSDAYQNFLKTTFSWELKWAFGAISTCQSLLLGIIPGKRDLHLIGYGMLITWVWLALFELYFAGCCLPFFLGQVGRIGVTILFLGKIQL